MRRDLQSMGRECGIGIRSQGEYPGASARCRNTLLNEIKMDKTNPLLGKEMEKVVRNQIRQNDPPETKQTYDRLIKEGFTEKEVMRKLAVVVAAEIYDVMKNEEPFNQQRFIERLINLPKEPE